MKKRKSGCMAVIVGLAAAAGILFTDVPDWGKKAAKELQQEWKQSEEIPFQEVDLSEEELAKRYYYQQLQEEERLAYREIVQGVKDIVGEIYVHCQDADRTNELFQYVLKDYPEIFWCDGTTTATLYEGSETYTTLMPAYLYDQAQQEAMKQEIEDAVNECLAGISAESTEYQKILYVYEYIVNTVDYDLDAPDNQNIYSVFAHHRSVCAGYSKAAQYLLNRLDVFCTYVTGTVSGGQSHAWNLVQCSGQYYYVDTTWGDPVFQASEEGEEPQENISYDYMCCDDEELRRTHTPDEDALLPVCNSMEENYYVVNGMYYTEYDSEEALRKANEVVAAKQGTLVYKFRNYELYSQAHDDIFQDIIKRAAKNLGEWYGLSEVQYRYLDDPKLNKITVYWEYE